MAEPTILAERYRVLSRLGEGGMGSVYLAEDAAMESRRVAVKMLPSVLLKDRDAYDQIRREALISIKLSHPNIATLRGFEENGGNPFLVLDYIEGETLEALLKRRVKLGEEETKKLLYPIAAALDYAHGERIVHGDVKPANIVVRNDGTPFILDFGIAVEMRETMSKGSGTAIRGSLKYMAPERIEGARPTAAEDVYSLAVIAYECIAGEFPFTPAQLGCRMKGDRPRPLPKSVECAAGVVAALSTDPAERPSACTGIFAPSRTLSARVFGPRNLRRLVNIGAVTLIFAVALAAVGCTLIHYYEFARAAAEQEMDERVRVAVEAALRAREGK